METGVIVSHKAAETTAIQSKTVAEFIAAADKFSRYRLQGIVNSAVDATYCTFNLKDATGSIKVYTVNNKSEWIGNIAQGDTVTLRGAYALYGSANHEVIDADIEAVKAAKVEVIEKTVDEALNAEIGSTLKVTGRIAKMVKNGFLLNGGTQNNILVYTTATISQSEGDIVSVTGPLTTYGTCYELKPSEDIVSSSKSIPATPEFIATSLTPSEVASYTGKASNLVSFTGTLSVSGTYYNVAFVGQTIKGSLQVSDGAVTSVTALNGKRVKCTGFYAGNSSKYFYIAITSSSDVVEDTDPYFIVSSDSLKISRYGGSVKFSIDVASSQTWTVASSNPEFEVSPASGTGPAEITVTANKNSADKARLANIVVSCSGFDDKTVVVSQAKGSGDGDVELIYEEFSNKQLKSDDATVLTSSSYANFSGATEKTYNSKYGGLKFGTGSYAGYITSKTLDLSKPFTVVINVLKYGSDTGVVQVTVGSVVKEITPTPTDTVYELEFGAATSTSTVKIGTSEKRAYIDNVVIVRHDK